MEARGAGERAAAAAAAALSSLADARRWGIWEVLSGGFMLNAVRLDQVRGIREEAQAALSCFRRRLTDLAEVPPAPALAGFSRSAESLDEAITKRLSAEFFGDVVVHQQIKGSIGPLKQARDQTAQLLDWIAGEIARAEGDPKGLGGRRPGGAGACR